MTITRTGLYRVQWRQTGVWSAHIYNYCSSPSVTHMICAADAGAALANGSMSEYETRDACEFFAQGALRVIVGPVDA